MKEQIIKAMTDESIMPFGKYKGEKMANIRPDYLLWLLENGNVYGKLRQYLVENKDVFESEIKYKIKQNHERNIDATDNRKT